MEILEASVPVRVLYVEVPSVEAGAPQPEPGHREGVGPPPPLAAVDATLDRRVEVAE
jgi:hypothetical protein